MTPHALLTEIESLPPEDQARVEKYVRILARRRSRRPRKTFPDELLRAISAEREELRRTQGLFDTLPLIREFRETGGR